MFRAQPIPDEHKTFARRERLRAERERQARCADGFDRVLTAADESIEPILTHLRSLRSPYNPTNRRNPH